MGCNGDSFIFFKEWCFLGCYAVWRNNPEDTILHSHRRENLKSYLYSLLSYFTLFFLQAV
jgi:hypothetical protein